MDRRDVGVDKLDEARVCGSECGENDDRFSTSPVGCVVLCRVVNANIVTKSGILEKMRDKEMMGVACPLRLCFDGGVRGDGICEWYL